MTDTMIFYFSSFPCTSLSTIYVSCFSSHRIIPQSPSLLSSGTLCHVVCSWVLVWIILMGEKQTEHMFKVFKNISMDGPRVLCFCNKIQKSSPYIMQVIKSRRKRWAGHLARIGKRRGVYRVLVGKPKRKTTWKTKV